MSTTKNIQVTAERDDIEAIEIVGLKMIIKYADGQVCEYRFEFAGCSF